MIKLLNYICGDGMEIKQLSYTGLESFASCVLTEVFVGKGIISPSHRVRISTLPFKFLGRACDHLISTSRCLRSRLHTAKFFRQVW